MKIKRFALLALLLPTLASAATVSGTVVREQREGVVALNVKTSSGEVVEVFCMEIGRQCTGLIESTPDGESERISRRLMGKQVTVTYEVEPNNGRAFGDDKEIRVLQKIVFHKGGAAVRK